mmetsp:Transcript_143169/g.399007  ORF Transcript_143169/g.399007 Transcript_143169/m.399007 type:complete len:510 (-) Transcript_143169:167-1696(-)
MGQAFSAVAHTVGDPCCEQENGDYVAHIDVKHPMRASDPVSTNVGDVFSITLTKVGDAKLGLDLDFVPTREAMPVRAVTGALAEEWNHMHPESQVLPGDRIVEVNGTRGVADQMMKALRDSDVVRITLVRLKKAKGVDDWEYVRTYHDRLEFEENMPTTIYELVPYQGDQVVAAGFGDAVTGQIKSTATVIPWGGQIGTAVSMFPSKPMDLYDHQPKLEPQPGAVVFGDPRFTHAREVGVIGFHHPGHEEAWDRLCGSGFLSCSYALGLAELQIETPCEPGARRPFRTAEAAFHALKFWSIAEEFSSLSGEAAFQRSQQLGGQEDFTYAGFGSGWKGMLAVLNAKFKPSSCWLTALLKTGDAYLLEHSSMRRDKGWLDERTGESNNWLGLLLMLIRDQHSGEGKWTEYVAGLVDIDSGKAHTNTKAQQWQQTVRSATRALDEEAERARLEPDPSESDFGGGMVSISRPVPTFSATDSAAQDYDDLPSEVAPSLLSKRGVSKEPWMASEF